MKKCSLIIRVSTDKQAENEEGSLKNQLQRLNAHIEYQNMAEGKKEWLETGKYVLKGVSGKDLLVKLYKHRSKGIMLSLGEPFPPGYKKTTSIRTLTALKS